MRQRSDRRFFLSRFYYLGKAMAALGIFSNESRSVEFDLATASEPVHTALSAREKLVNSGIDPSLFIKLWALILVQEYDAPLLVKGASQPEVERQKIQDQAGAGAQKTVQNAAQKHTRADEFLQGFASLFFNASESLQSELLLLSRALNSAVGRLIITGQSESLVDMSLGQLGVVLENMARSRFGLRRKVEQGLVVFIGMSHMSREAFATETGYPGVPDYVATIWGEMKETVP